MYIAEEPEKNSRRRSDRPEFLEIEEWRDSYARRLAEELGYTGIVKTEDDSSKISGPETEPVVSPRGDGLTVLSSYVKINTYSMSTFETFRESCEQGLLRGLQYDQIKGTEIANKETLDTLETLLDGQISWLREEDRSTERLYREIRDGFEEKTLIEKEKKYLPGKARVEIGYNGNIFEGKYITAIQKTDERDKKLLETLQRDINIQDEKGIYTVEVKETSFTDIENSAYDREFILAQLEKTENVLRKKSKNQASDRKAKT